MDQDHHADRRPKRDRGWMAHPQRPELVSVIVPAFNRGWVIAAALDSVWNQSYRPIQLIVADDGSTDETLDVVRAWHQQHPDDDSFHLQYLRQDNRGASAARNLGLGASRGEFIQFLDSDDLLLPRKLQTQVAALRTFPRHEVVWSDLKHITWADPDGITNGIVRADRASRRWKFVRGARLSRFPSQLVVCLYRRSLCRQLGPLNETLTASEDWEYNTRILAVVDEAIHAPGLQYLARAHQRGRLTNVRNDRSERLSTYLSAVDAAERFAHAASEGPLKVAARLRLMHRYRRIAWGAMRNGDQQIFQAALEGLRRNRSWRLRGCQSTLAALALMSALDVLNKLLRPFL